jgi:serine protease Do
MNINIRLCVSIVVFSCCLMMSSFSNASIASAANLAPMLETVLPAVVNIKAQIKITDFNTLQELIKQRNKNLQDKESQDAMIPNTFTSVASGVIVDAKNGYILTNAHVVNEAQTINVTLGDGRHFTAKMIGSDKPSDVALLQIKAKNLTALVMADSNLLRVGDFVAAIGNPFGLNQTVTSGIISALGRTTLGIESYESFIQTDASINPGNSGGALINIQGQLIGINTAILAPGRGSIGIGFAIPSNMAKSIMKQLIEYGNVKRGVLGVGAQDISPELAGAFDINNTKGAVVAQLLPGSPAERAGMKVGDIITAVNSSPVKNASDVVNTIGFLRVDSKIVVNVLRKNTPVAMNITLSDPQQRKLKIQQLDPFLYGVGLRDFSLLSPVHGAVQGVFVTSVEEDSRSFLSDLRPGDVIISANQQAVKSIEELKQQASKADKTLLLNVLRGPSALFVVISKESQ